MSSSPSLRSVLALAVVLVLGAAHAVATPPNDDRASDPLDHAAVRALAAVVRVDVHIPITAVVDGGRRIPVRDEVRVIGTGFGVGPRDVVTVRPVVRPADTMLIDDLRSRRVPGMDNVSDDARPVRGPVRVTIIGPELQASADADVGDIHAVNATPVQNPRRDLIHLRTGEPGPYLGVEDGQTQGNAVIAVGVGDEPGRVAALRRLRFDVQAKVTGRPDLDLVALDGPVTRGDLGAPILDEDGFVHGVVYSRGRGETPPLALRAGAVLRLVPAAGPHEDNPFGTAMDRMATGEYDLAAAALRDAVPRAPSSLIVYERQRAEALAGASYEVSNRRSQWRIPLLIVAVAALVVCGLILRWLRRDALRAP